MLRTGQTLQLTDRSIRSANALLNSANTLMAVNSSARADLDTPAGSRRERQFTPQLFRGQWSGIPALSCLVELGVDHASAQCARFGCGRHHRVCGALGLQLTRDAGDLRPGRCGPEQPGITDVRGKPVVRLERVRVPDYLDTTDIVTQRAGGRIHASTTGHWGDRLSTEVARALAGSLAAQLPEVSIDPLVFDGEALAAAYGRYQHPLVRAEVVFRLSNYQALCITGSLI